MKCSTQIEDYEWKSRMYVNTKSISYYKAFTNILICGTNNGPNFDCIILTVRIQKYDVQDDQHEDCGRGRETAENSQPSFPEFHPAVSEDDQPHQEAHDHPGEVGQVAGAVGVARHQV